MLISSTSGYGHIFPMVPLARALQAAGHTVLWATTSEASPLIAAAGIEVVPAGLTHAEHIRARDALVAAASDVRPDEMGEYMFPRLFGGAATPRMLADLLPLATAWAPDLLIHEQGELAAPLVAAVLDRPCVTHSFGGATPPSVVQEAGAYVAPLWVDHGRAQPPYAGCYRSAYLDICPSLIQTVPLEHISRILRLRPVPWAGPDPERLPEGLEVESAAPLVYVTLGTVQNRAARFKAAVDAVASLAVRVLVTVGPDNDPALLGRQPTNVTVERYVAQTAVLPRCAAVVSHGGSGTVLAGLGHGVPQVCLPQAADQFRNAEGVERSGSGRSLRPDAAGAEAIADEVRTVLQEPAYRRNAGLVRAEIDAMPAPAAVVEQLERIVSTGELAFGGLT
ncbi:MAG: glycosyltransferase [Chloroflexota bacterium]